MHDHGENIIMCGWIEAPCMTNECMCIASRPVCFCVYNITTELILEANVSYLWLAQVIFAIVWKTRTSFISSPTSLTRRGEEEGLRTCSTSRAIFLCSVPRRTLRKVRWEKGAWHTAQRGRFEASAMCTCVCVHAADIMCNFFQSSG